MKKIVIANWKMNPESLRETEEILKGVKTKISKLKKTNVVLCPPSIYLNRLDKLNKHKNLSLGAQDFFYEQKGSWTGKISSKMVRNIGADYVILGHSELKELGEDEVLINKKVKIALKNRLKPIVCIGENERDKDGKYFTVLENQLLNILSGVGPKFINKIILAYEPIWAIGKKSKRRIRPEELLETTIFIKKVLVDKYGTKRLSKIKIIYGGSVNSKNIEDLVEGGVNGFLVGRDSLIPENFNKIIQVVDKI